MWTVPKADDSPHLESCPGPLASPGLGTTKLSSAEDMRLATTSPSATPSEPRLEEHVAEPVEAESPELNPTPALKANRLGQGVLVTPTAPPPGTAPLHRTRF